MLSSNKTSSWWLQPEEHSLSVSINHRNIILAYSFNQKSAPCYSVCNYLNQDLKHNEFNRKTKFTIPFACLVFTFLESSMNTYFSTRSSPSSTCSFIFSCIMDCSCKWEMWLWVQMISLKNRNHGIKWCLGFNDRLLLLISYNRQITKYQGNFLCFYR